MQRSALGAYERERGHMGEREAGFGLHMGRVCEVRGGVLSSFPPRQRRVRSVLSPRCVRAAARRAVLSPSLYLSGSACFL